jgi:flagellar protein FliS
MDRPGAAIAAYRTALRTVAPLHLVVMLYDGALVRIASAAEAAYRRDYEKQFNEAMRAAQILNGLSCCLDMQAGGKVAISLRDMYQAVCAALLGSVGKKNGGESCQKIASAVRLTRNAWAEIAKLPLAADPITITKIADESLAGGAAVTTARSAVSTAQRGKLSTWGTGKR